MVEVATPEVAKILVINFGDKFPQFNSAEKHCKVVALSNNYNRGIYYAFIDPSLGPDVCAQYDSALRGLGENEGRLIPARNTTEGKNKSGVKFFKIDGRVKEIKLKLAGGHNLFLKGDLVASKLRVLENGLTTTCHLVCFSRMQNHNEEQQSIRQHTL